MHELISIKPQTCPSLDDEYRQASPGMTSLKPLGQARTIELRNVWTFPRASHGRFAVMTICPSCASREFRFLKHRVGKYVTCLVVIWTTSFGLTVCGITCYRIPVYLPLGYPPLGQSSLGYPPLGHPPLGHPPMWCSPMGYPPLGYISLGYPPLEHPPLGCSPVGYLSLGYPALWYPPLG